MRSVMISMAAALVLLSTAGCAPTYRNHGYIPPEDVLQELVVGIDTRATVEDVAGPPSAGGVLEDGDFYYVRSRVRTFGATAPKEIERRVLAVTFDDTGVLSNVEEFGLEAGRVVVLSRRVTDSGATNVSFVRQLLGNLGQFDAASAFGN